MRKDKKFYANMTPIPKKSVILLLKEPTRRFNWQSQNLRFLENYLVIRLVSGIIKYITWAANP